MNTVVSSPPSPVVASVLLSCANEVGVMAAVATFFAERKLDLVRHSEFVDGQQLFARFEWVLDSRWAEEQAFLEEFLPVVKDCQEKVSVRFMNQRQSLGLFVSGQSHALLDVLNKNEAKFFPLLECSFIVGNDESMRNIADRYGIPFFFVETNGDALAFERQQLDIVHRYKPDYLGLAHYEKVLSANFIAKANCPIINVQHSSSGMTEGNNPYQTVYSRGAKLIGATSRIVTAELAQGPIVEQGVRRVNVGASIEDLTRLGRDVECQVFVLALRKALEHKIIIDKNRTIVFD